MTEVHLGRNDLGEDQWLDQRTGRIRGRRPVPLRTAPPLPTPQQRRQRDDFALNAMIESAHALIKERRVAIVHLERILNVQIDKAMIDAEQNTELRRMMLERYGLAKFFHESAAVLVAKDVYGKLWDLPVGPMQMLQNFSSPQVVSSWSTGMILGTSGSMFGRVGRQTNLIRIVEVLNSTTEWPMGASGTASAADAAACQHKPVSPRPKHFAEGFTQCAKCGAHGEHKTYLLRVPPTTQTPRAGIAWTFGLQEHEYEPDQMA